MPNHKEAPHKKGDYIERAAKLMAESWVADTGYVPHEHADLDAAADSVVGSYAVLKKAIMDVLRNMEPMKPGTLARVKDIEMDGLNGRVPHPTQDDIGREGVVVGLTPVVGFFGDDAERGMVMYHVALFPITDGDPPQLFQFADYELERVK